MKPDLNAPVLPEDLRSWLHEALEPDPPRPDDDARLKRRVLRSIARDSTPAHLTVPASPADWHDFGPGLRRKVLHEAGGIMSYLLRLAPGPACRRIAIRSTRNAWCSKAKCRSARCGWPPAASTSAAATCCTTGCAATVAP